MSIEDVIEPCFGEGAFIKNLIGKPKNIDAIDTYVHDIFYIMQVHIKNNIHINFNSCIIQPNNRKVLLFQTEYDATINNPPYGLKFTQEYRKIMIGAFSNVYAKESYALFFYFTLKTLKKGGRYVFFIGGLTYKITNLRYMRHFILQSAKPSHIIQFKSRRFGSVNFGYSNMCIIAGNVGSLGTDCEVNWIDAVDSNQPLLRP
ncbi:hypothetical protein QM042_02380 [Escherichia coli]|uniref:Eco57I restriction-modification methylase domain-containing protein n=1 Tax=Escherichia coli TaxID=562 RepID=UPI0039868033